MDQFLQPPLKDFANAYQAVIPAVSRFLKAPAFGPRRGVLEDTLVLHSSTLVSRSHFSLFSVLNFLFQSLAPSFSHQDRNMRNFIWSLALSLFQHLSFWLDPKLAKDYPTLSIGTPAPAWILTPDDVQELYACGVQVSPLLIFLFIFF